ncbi:hypothetical protein AK830_g11923 [Neonectria ditissima]|uniref:Uncharacterized protein n=1 Tax=Neonectria ditissima TaxID=78410 RepID=A0A0P7B6L3_9HYPO|nr:hypothetical protein AK830_g11923 [Neonectria ditissima]
MLRSAREAGSSFTNATNDFRQLQIQLAFCYFFQGTWRLAEPIVTKLAQSKAGKQDLALPPDFIYTHPSNEIQYLQSKSNFIEPIFHDEDPQKTGLVELDAGPSPMSEGQGEGVARNGTIRSSNVTSLRVKILEYQRDEADTMKEVLFVHPAESQTADDADDEASPVTEKGSLRRRLTHLLGSAKARRVGSGAMAIRAGSESPADEIAPVTVSPVPDSPAVASPSGSQCDGMCISPMVDYSGPIPATAPKDAGNDAEPTGRTETQPFITPQLADDETDSASAPRNHHNVSRNQNSSPRGQGGPGVAGIAGGINSFTAVQQSSAHATKSTFDSIPLPHAQPDILPKTTMDTAAILASLKTMEDKESLQNAKLNLKILLRRLGSLNRNQFLTPDVQRAIQNLEQTEALDYEQGQDSVYDTMDDGDSGTESASTPRTDRHGVHASNFPNLKRVFSWKMGSEDAYMTENF